MTIEQAKTRRDEIMANANIGPGQQAAQLMRLQAQLRRLHPGVDLAGLRKFRLERPWHEHCEITRCYVSNAMKISSVD